MWVCSDPAHCPQEGAADRRSQPGLEGHRFTQLTRAHPGFESPVRAGAWLRGTALSAGPACTRAWVPSPAPPKDREEGKERKTGAMRRQGADRLSPPSTALLAPAGPKRPNSPLLDLPAFLGPPLLSEHSRVPRPPCLRLGGPFPSLCLTRLCSCFLSC